MPKKSKLETDVAYCGPSSRGVFKKYKLMMDWDGPLLSYKKNRWVRLEFKNVTQWRIAFASQPYSGEGPIAVNQMPRIILETNARLMRIQTREFAFHPGFFENWLYWMIRAILKYSNAPVPEDSLSQLTPKHRTKISTRRRIKSFDQSHEIFVGIIERLKKGEPDILKSDNLHKKKHPERAFKFNIEGPEIHAQTHGGMKYSQVVRKIGSGGSDTVIFEINKLLKPIMQTQNTPTGVRWKIVRPAEPMAAKSARSPFSLAGDLDPTNLEELIKEARVMAALGKHPNIVGLIDAHVLSSEKSSFRVFLFMEKGYHTLEEYDKFELPLKPPLIRKYVLGVLAGVSHMHEHFLYHLDMKPQNVIICKSDVPKLIDFGLTRGKMFYPNKQTMLKEKWDGYGTVGYIPPESFEAGKISQVIHLVKRDSYAVGMTFLNSLLAPYFNWKKPSHKAMEGRDYIVKRIRQWEKIVRKEKSQNELQRAGLFEVAEMALTMINENPDARITIQDARDFLVGHLSRRRRQRTGNRKVGNLDQLKDKIHLSDHLKQLRGQ